MKIAMMTNNYKPFIGGVPVSVERLSESLRKLGQEVVVFAPRYEGFSTNETEVRFRSVRPGIYGGFAVPDSLDPAIEEAFAAGNFDVIHVHHPMLIGNTALHLSGKYDVPIVFTYHTRYEQYLHYIKLSGAKKLVPAYIKAFANRCDGVIAPTKGMKQYLETIGVHTPVNILPTGLCEDSYRIEEEKVKALRRRLLGDKKHLYCTVSRLAKEKNIDFLLESLACFKKNGNSDFKLALIGEGPQEKHLRNLAKQLDLEEEIVFVGKRPNCEIKNYCAAAELFLFASTTETQGIVSLEAMAAKTPVLAVCATGTRDIVVNEENGYMTGEDTAEFAGQLERLKNEKLLEKLKEGAIKTAQEYHAERIALSALDCYSAAIYEHAKAKGERTAVLSHVS